MPTPYRPDRARATRRRELRDRILRALRAAGPMTGPVRPAQRGLSRALEALDCDRPAVAAALVLREAIR